MSMSTSPVTSGREAWSPAAPSGSTPSATTARARSRSVITPTGLVFSQITTEPTLRSRMRAPTLRRLSWVSAVTTPWVITSRIRTARLYRLSRPRMPLPLPVGWVTGGKAAGQSQPTGNGYLTEDHHDPRRPRNGRGGVLPGHAAGGGLLGHGDGAPGRSPHPGPGRSGEARPDTRP